MAVYINPTGLDWRHFLVTVPSDNKLLGCGQINPNFDGSRELVSIAVRDQARGQSVARAVIQDLLFRKTIRHLYLMRRTRLESLYVNLGFARLAYLKRPVIFTHQPC
jgi:N-acetylglutamate synthase-like GNAT family acetyltransferase